MDAGDSTIEITFPVDSALHVDFTAGVQPIGMLPMGTALKA